MQLRCNAFPLQVANDSLQRVYGVAFPEKDLLKQYLAFQEQV
jgi:threonyl-tRNA synthetase